jgi:hypothetical protein
MGDVYVRTIRHNRDTLVAVCDAELLGCTLEGGRTPFEVSERFYGGSLSSLDEALEAMSKASICNIVGKKIVEAAIEKELVRKTAVIYIGDVPHAQIVHLR